MTQPPEAPPHPLVDENGIVDFTIPREPIRLKVDGDTFSAPAIISGITLKRLAGKYEKFANKNFNKLTEEEYFESLTLVADIFRLIMPGRSGQCFADRLLLDPEIEEKLAESEGRAPRLSIDLERQAMPVINYLLERYGLRPTRQSSPLPASSGTGDLTDGAQAEESTGAPSNAPSNS